MADTQSKELKVRGKQEVASPAEQTTPGLSPPLKKNMSANLR